MKPRSVSRRSLKLTSQTRRVIAGIFQRLNYQGLGKIYCDKGGRAFWQARREPCQRMGIALAEVLLGRLAQGGRSLYVGAGVAELPMIITERLELGRDVAAFNLRRAEAQIINRACGLREIPAVIRAGDAASASGRFDHLWIVSVLNDPECFPELAALSYGTANPATFDPRAFLRERRTIRTLARTCLSKLRLPALVTTSVEEIPWITEWCMRRKIPCVVEEKDYPTAIVEDPVCFIRVGL